MSNRQLPEELLFEILTWLPVKSLLRLTAVSKWWRNLITSPAFISAHRNAGNSATNNILLVFLDYKEEKYSIINDTDHKFLTEPPIPIKLSKEYFCVVGCNNGIVCLYDNHAVTLWNPSIRKFKMLPCPSIWPDCSFYSVLGFGVSPQSVDDLKVVRIVYESSEGVNCHPYRIPPEVEIYSLKTRMWTRITTTGLNYYIINDMAFVNGAVHWIGCKWLENDRIQYSIAVFNMADDLFGEIMLPRELALEFDSSVMVWDESVAIAKYGLGLCELWVMKEYGFVESWTRLHSIDIGLTSGIKRIFSFRKNGEVLLSTYNKNLVLYCPNTRVINDVDIYGISSSYCVDKYLESLVLLQEQSHIVDGLCPRCDQKISKWSS